MDNCLEVEETYICPNPSEIENRLQKELELCEPTFYKETDVYYIGKSNSFLSDSCGLRIRNDNYDYNVLTFKEKNKDLDDIRVKKETNTPFAPSDRELVENILETLGCFPYCKVEKERRFYATQDADSEIHITIDKINNLYSFMEVEIIASDNEDPQEVRKKLEAFAEKTQLNKLETLSLNYRDFVVVKKMEQLHITKESVFYIPDTTPFDRDILAEAKKYNLITDKARSDAFTIAQIGSSLYINGIKIEYPNGFLKQLICLKTR